MPEQTTSAPTELESISPAQAAQEYGRHSEEHTMAQIARISEGLISRGEQAVNHSPPTAEEVAESDSNSIGTTTHGDNLMVGSSVNGDGEVPYNIVRTDIARPTVHQLERDDVGTGGQPAAPEHKLTSVKISYNGETRVREKLGVKVEANSNDRGKPRISSEIVTEVITPGNSREVKPITTLPAQRKAAGQTLGKIRGQVAKEEITKTAEEVKAVDSIFDDTK